MEILDAARDRAGGYKVDVSRGERIGSVSSEWFSRPADERYLSLSDLYAAVRDRTERSRTRTVEGAAIRVEASRDDAERLALMLPGSDTPIAPTHWSFGQLAGLIGAPAAYLRQLPAPLAHRCSPSPAFMIRRNPCSQSNGIRVHDPPERAHTKVIGQSD